IRFWKFTGNPSWKRQKALLEMMMNPPRNILFIGLLILILGCASTGPPEPLIFSYEEAKEALQDSDEDLRIEAVRYLGDTRSINSIPLIAGRLKDESVLVRIEATLALNNLSNPKTISPLRGALEDEDEAVRFSAASSLFELGDYSGEDALIEGMGSRREDFRFQAVLFLGRMRSRKAIPGMIKLLKDPQPRIRSTSAYVLGLLKARAALSPLIKTMSDPEVHVRKDSWEAVKAISGEDYPFHYDNDPLIRERELRVWEEWLVEREEEGKMLNVER
ncbi:MAG: HEAT repeat domain-containing protein, partial [Candidatus Auribacterota bacterium]|nr:HEAT repeat domain-containing protein [Candidatus Auribacterota bacterium]